MLRASDGSMTAVDSEGRVLNSVGNVSVEGIPVVDVGDVDQGLSDQAVHETLSILGRLDESMRQRISSVSAQTKDSITTVLDGGNYTIVWGDSSDLKLKKAVVDKIINDPNVIGDKHQVDVSAPLRPHHQVASAGHVRQACPAPRRKPGGGGRDDAESLAGAGPSPSYRAGWSPGRRWSATPAYGRRTGPPGR